MRSKRANHWPALDAAIASCLPFEGLKRRAGAAERWALVALYMSALLRFRSRLLLPVFVGIWGAAFWPGGPVYAQSWLVTNANGSDSRSKDFIKEYEVTPSVSTNIPNPTAYYNKAARLFLRLRERMAIGVRAQATYGGRIVADYEAHAIGSFDTSAMTDKEVFLTCRTNTVELKVGYYRGRVYYGRPSSQSDEWITVFSSVDKQHIAVVPDSGSFYVSENSGASWKLISAAGEYECTLSATPAGSDMVAVVSVATTADTNKAQNAHRMATDPWYSAASAADGSQVVLTGGSAQPSPALSIRAFEGKVVVSWPALFTGFVLQQAIDPTVADWNDVKDAVIVTNNQNQVTTTPSKGKSFFRLNSSR